MAKPKSKVVVQFHWTAVVEVESPISPRYDIKEWDLYRMRWGNMSQSKGFGDILVATRIAVDRSAVIATMLENNRTPPRGIEEGKKS